MLMPLVPQTCICFRLLHFAGCFNICLQKYDLSHTELSPLRFHCVSSHIVFYFIFLIDSRFIVIQPGLVQLTTTMCFIFHVRLEYLQQPLIAFANGWNCLVVQRKWLHLGMDNGYGGRITALFIYNRLSLYLHNRLLVR